jgi:radical SAM superfamily enzyme YgiQ (UPF0313 family)
MKILFGMRDDGDMTEPMNIMLLSALARRAGHDTDIWVMERDDLKDTIARKKPDVVAFSCITGSHTYYLKAGQEIKKRNPHIKTIFGGPHFTFFPGEILKEEHDFIDIECAGEGDDAWPHILHALENNGSLESIPNVITRKNALSVLEGPTPGLILVGGLAKHQAGSAIPPDQMSLSKGHLRERETNLDDLPFMDRGLIYDNTAFRYRYKRTLMASRGCPFRCTYCFEHQWNALYSGVGKGKSARIRQWYSVDRFLDELEYIKKNWDTRFFKIYDDVMIPFPNDEEIAWHQEFCSKYPRRIGIPFHHLTRCDVVVSLLKKGIDVVADWKKIGMASFTMSIESGNAFIRDNVVIRDMSGQEIVKAFSHSYNQGVYTFPNTILGIPAPLIPHPDDPDFDAKLARVGQEVEMLRRINNRKIDLDSVMQTAKQWFRDDRDRRLHVVRFLYDAGLRHTYLDYNRESVHFTLDTRPGFAEFGTLFPYPKTKATEYCIARGDFDGNFAKLHASYQTKSPLTCYTDKERTVIQNMSLLGTFLTLFAGSRNPLIRLLDRPMRILCLDYLAHIENPRATRLYLWLYATTKAYLHRKRIYPIRYSLKERFRFYRQMWALDFWKQARAKKPQHRNERPAQFLGGPPSM